MRIYDMPKGCMGNSGSVRIAVHGSCRIHDPFESLVNCGEGIKVWANDLAVSYSMGEALQMLRYTLGTGTLPANSLHYIFDDPLNVAPWQPRDRRVLESVDVFLLEVSELRQVRCHDAYFQIQVFLRNFVSRFPAALAEWFSAFSRGQAISAELLHRTIAALPSMADEPRQSMEDVLRDISLETMDVALAKRSICAMKSSLAIPWIYVSHFTAPDLVGDQMEDRKKLANVLLEASQSCDVGFFDPSVLLAEHGTSVALANDGRDIHHYAPGFEQVVGEALRRQACGAVHSVKNVTQVKGDVRPKIDPKRISLLTSTLNTMLVACHQQRLESFGVDESGLHAHYALLLERKQIVAKSERDLVDIITRYLPDFEEYHVLQAGLGEAAFLLAALGRQVLCCDPFAGRFSAILAGVAFLQGRNVFHRNNLAAVQATIPDRGTTSPAIAIATQLSLTLSLDEEEKLLRRLEQYDAILFRPNALMRLREGAGDVDWLVKRFERSGFTKIKEYPQHNLVYCARHDDKGRS